MKLQSGIALASLVLAGCQAADEPQPSRSPEVRQTEVAETVSEPEDPAVQDCGLSDYPISATIDVQALVDADREQGQSKASHLVLARYRLDEAGKMTHLKLLRPSSYGVEITEHALSVLEKQQFTPTVVEGKAVPVCGEVAMEIHLR